MTTTPQPKSEAELPAATPSAASSPVHFDVFLSHNSADKPTIERIARALQAKGADAGWQLAG